jgi:hypothetical protein
MEESFLLMKLGNNIVCILFDSLIRWERINAKETTLMAFLLNGLKPAICRDMPVYLPYFAPKNVIAGTVR